MPAGTGIPLVIQLGKWRRQITIDVAPCVDNVLPMGTARLPRNQSEGNIPLTAISTGRVDTLECLLRKIGISDSEFTNPGGTGRMRVYQGMGDLSTTTTTRAARIDGNTPTEAVLTGSTSGAGEWSRYDQILLPCEGSEYTATAPPNARTNRQ